MHNTDDEELDRRIQELIAARERNCALAQRNVELGEELLRKIQQLRREHGWLGDADAGTLGVREPNHPRTPGLVDRVALREP